MSTRWLFAVVLFVTLACGCGGSDRGADEPAPAATPNPERVRLERFWAAFNAATQARLDGHHQEAVQLYREALELEPDHGDALFFLGHGLAQLGDAAGALGAWERLVAVHPSSQRGFTEIGMLLSSARPGAPLDLERAREAFEAAFSLNREETGSMLRLAELDLATGMIDEAKRWLEAVTLSNPKSVGAPWLLGYLAWKRGDAGAARSRLAEARERAGEAVEHAPSFEGQTKAGARALTAEGSEHRSLLAPFWTLWARSPAQTGGGPDPARAYAELDAFLGQLAAGELADAVARRAAVVSRLDPAE